MSTYKTVKPDEGKWVVSIVNFLFVKLFYGCSDASTGGIQGKDADIYIISYNRM